MSSELMAEPRTRKVIILESPLLPLRIKDIVAKILFQHLGVPSVTFTLSPLCALLSLGRITGLVVDVGFIESIALPVGLTSSHACLMNLILLSARFTLQGPCSPIYAPPHSLRSTCQITCAGCSIVSLCTYPISVHHNPGLQQPRLNLPHVLV